MKSQRSSTNRRRLVKPPRAFDGPTRSSWSALCRSPDFSRVGRDNFPGDERIDRLRESWHRCTNDSNEECWIVRECRLCRRRRSSTREISPPDDEDAAPNDDEESKQSAERPSSFRRSFGFDEEWNRSAWRCEQIWRSASSNEWPREEWPEDFDSTDRVNGVDGDEATLNTTMTTTTSLSKVKITLTDSIGGDIQRVSIFGFIHQKVIDVFRHCIGDWMNTREKELSFIVVVDLQHQIDAFLQLIDALLIETNPRRIETIVGQIQITIIMTWLTLSRRLIDQGMIQLNLSRRNITDNHLVTRLTGHRTIFILGQSTDRWRRWRLRTFFFHFVRRRCSSRRLFDLRSIVFDQFMDIVGFIVDHCNRSLSFAQRSFVTFEKCSQRRRVSSIDTRRLLLLHRLRIRHLNMLMMIGRGKGAMIDSQGEGVVICIGLFRRGVRRSTDSVVIVIRGQIDLIVTRTRLEIGVRIILNILECPCDKKRLALRVDDVRWTAIVVDRCFHRRSRRWTDNDYWRSSTTTSFSPLSTTAEWRLSRHRFEPTVRVALAEKCSTKEKVEQQASPSSLYFHLGWSSDRREEHSWTIEATREDNHHRSTSIDWRIQRLDETTRWSPTTCSEPDFDARKDWQSEREDSRWSPSSS